jgi:hypothetical protein
MARKKDGDWMAGLSICVFLPMLVNLIAMVGYLLGY